MAQYTISLPASGPIDAVDLLGLGRITKDPKPVDLTEAQLKSVRARGLVVTEVVAVADDEAPAGRRKAARREE